MKTSDYISNSFGPDGKPDGYVWHMTGDDDHLALGGHEAALGPILESLCDPHKAYVNVGAHIGTWAIRMAKNVSHVYAVEANYATVQKLDHNVMLNKLWNDVTILVGAAWDTDGQQLVLVDEKSMETGGSTRVEPLPSNPGPRGYEKAYRATDLAVTSTLDSLDLKPIGLISMDVEGGEAHVLRGARELILRDRPNMLIELHDGHPGTDSDLREQVTTLLREFNYNYWSFKGCPPEEHLVCRPNDGIIAYVEPSSPSELTNYADDDIIDLRNFFLKG